MVTKKKKEEQNPEANVGLGKFAGTREAPKEEGFRQVTERREEGGTGVETKNTGRGLIISSETGGTILAKPNESVNTRKVGRGQIAQVGETPAFTITGGGVNQTMFGSNLPPEEALGGNINIAPSQEELRNPQLSPQEQYKQLKLQQFNQGMQTGDFGNLSYDEVNNFAQAQGIIPREAPQTITESKSLIDKAAEFGVAPAVAISNIISKGLKRLGIADIGTITREQFASTGLGKGLGLTTVALEALLAGRIAASLLPVAGTTVTASTAPRAIIGANVAKTGILAKIGASKLVFGTLVAGWGVSKIEGRVGDLETSIVNMRESMTLIGQGVEQGALTPTEAILLFDEIETDINETERAIHMTQNISIKAWLGKGKEVETRIQKARFQLNVERGKFTNSLGSAQIPAGTFIRG